jgi:hypothetical protein
VSDVYVRFGNDFNAAVAAFASFNIDMRYVYPLLEGAAQFCAWSERIDHALSLWHKNASIRKQKWFAITRATGFPCSVI